MSESLTHRGGREEHGDLSTRPSGVSYAQRTVQVVVGEWAAKTGRHPSRPCHSAGYSGTFPQCGFVVFPQCSHPHVGGLLVAVDRDECLSARCPDCALSAMHHMPDSNFLPTRVENKGVVGK